MSLPKVNSGGGRIFNLNNLFRNIDTRKLLGTIVGIMMFSACVVYFTYAYYEWKSDEISIALTIHEASVECTLGPDVNVSNIGPVLKISDGVKTSFGIENTFTEDMAVNVTLDITSISEKLLNESFKWAIVEDQEGGENYDYENPIIEGNFKNFRVGTNLITTSLPVTTQNTTNYQFIVYIDGNIKNDISMMQNSMEASLSLGNCGENYIPYDELTQFAFYSADDNSLTFTYDYPVAVGDVYQGKTVTNLYTGYDTTKYNSASAVPWYADGNYDDITLVTFLSTTTPTSTAFWFNDFVNVTNINVSKLDTKNVTTMREMFNNCSSLEAINVDNFNTSNVIDMWSMFEDCKSLLELDLSNFDTSNVTNMNPPGHWAYGGMFHGCSSLKYLNISNWDVSNVTSFGNMFWECTSLTILDLSDWNTSNVTNMGNMFHKCNSLMTLNLENFNTSQVTTMGSMFCYCESLITLNLENFDTSQVTNMAHMFRDCKSLTELDLSNFDTSQVTTMGSMFGYCESLIKLNLENFDTSQVTDMGNMFHKCERFTNLDLSNFNTSQVTIMQNMFRECRSLTELDLSNFDTSQVTTMQIMFYYCESLIKLNLENFDTSNVTTMNSMFEGCGSLTNLDLSNFNTSNVTDMSGMFGECKGLLELDLSNFNTSQVTNMSSMFHSCYNLITSLVIMNPRTTYTNMFSGITNTSSASITLYYVGDIPETTDVNESTETLVNNMKGTNTRVFIGGCYGDYCPSTGDESVEEDTV